MSLLLALSTFASARLGETKEQCVERYGEVGKVDDNGTSFSDGGYILCLQFGSDGRCGLLTVSRRKLERLSSVEVVQDMSVKGDGYGKVKTENGNYRWHGDGVEAFLYNDNMLFVSTASYIAEQRRAF